MTKDLPAMREGIVVSLMLLGVKGIWARASQAGSYSSWEEVISVFKQAIDEAPQEIEELSRLIIISRHSCGRL